MRNTGHKIRNTRYEPGFTVVELLIALAITSLLLAAVATAFNASVKSYTENEKMFKTFNTSRQALSRMTSQIRTGVIDPNDLTNDSCKLLCADGSTITYRYDSTDKKLYLHSNDTNNDYVLCENIAAMTFIKDSNTPTGDVKSVQISITAENGNIQQTTSSAAAVRKILN